MKHHNMLTMKCQKNSEFLMEIVIAIVPLHVYTFT